MTRVASATYRRQFGWLSFYSLILLAWLAVWQMARGGGDWICGPQTLRLLLLGGFWPLLAMWLVMVAAMMLPTLIPALRAYEDLPSRSGASALGWVGLLTGYLLAWALASIGFAAIQAGALEIGLIDRAGLAQSPWLTAILLALAGSYQFSRLKHACQNGCLTPVQYFLAHWRVGAFGGVRMGLGLGVICIGCCWAIMALGLVGGMTSLLWMGLATLFMIAEKLPDIGERLRRPAGAALLLVAGVVAIHALGLA